MKKFLKFLVVGGSGFGIYFGGLAFLTEILGLYYIISAAISATFSINWNYFMNNYWSFGDQKNENHAIGLSKFVVATGIETGIFFVLMIFFTELIGIQYMISNVIALMIRLPIKFVMCRFWVYTGVNND